MNIALLFGGKSAEHEVSLRSAQFIYRNTDPEHQVFLIGLDKNNQPHHFSGEIEQLDENWMDLVSNQEVVFYNSQKAPGLYNGGQLVAEFDFFFPVLHGPYGEDGKIQGLLELTNKPYTGCGVLASALAMDKAVANDLFVLSGINHARHLTFWSHQERALIIRQSIDQLGLPCFVKPANMGSSVGISKAKTAAELTTALEVAFKYDRKIVIEEAINARELEVAVLGNQDNIRVSSVGEIVPDQEFYSYDSKYSDSQSEIVIPAQLTTEVVTEIQAMARRAYQILNCEGLARVDFLLDGDSQKVYINEINTMPGFTSISMYPKLWQHDGLEASALIAEVINLGLERQAQIQHLRSDH